MITIAIIHTVTSVDVNQLNDLRHPQNHRDLRHVAKLTCDGRRQTNDIIFTHGDDFNAEYVLVVVYVATDVVRDQLLGRVRPAKIAFQCLIKGPWPRSNSVAQFL